MKIYDAIVLLRQECLIGTSLEECILAKAAAGHEIAQRLLDAEELFLPPDTRPLRQLRNPRYKLYTTDLPDGVTGIVSDGITDWRTDSSRPDSLDAIYFRSKL